MRQDVWQLARKAIRYKDGPEYWDVLLTGTKEECEEHLERNNRFWYDGEEVILFRVSYTAVKAFKGYVTYKEQDL